MSETAAPSGVITRRHESGACEVTLDRPQALNAISTQLALTLIDTLRAIAADPTPPRRPMI